MKEQKEKERETERKREKEQAARRHRERADEAALGEVHEKELEEVRWYMGIPHLSCYC